MKRCLGTADYRNQRDAQGDGGSVGGETLVEKDPPEAAEKNDFADSLEPGERFDLNVDRHGTGKGRKVRERMEKLRVKRAIEDEEAQAYKEQLEEREKKETELANLSAQVAKLTEEAHMRARDLADLEDRLEEQRRRADLALDERAQAERRAADLTAQLRAAQAANGATIEKLDQGLVAIIDRVYGPVHTSPRDLRHFIARFFADNYEQLRRGAFRLPSSGPAAAYSPEFAADVMDLLFEDKKALEVRVKEKELVLVATREGTAGVD